MNPWLLLIPAFLTFIIGSYTTYTKEIRDSSYYLLIFVSLSVVCGWLWVKASRKLDNTMGILIFSMVWDLLMAIAYYAIPVIFKGENLGWQTYAATAVMICGMIWFKVVT